MTVFNHSPCLLRIQLAFTLSKTSSQVEHSLMGKKNYLASSLSNNLVQEALCGDTWQLYKEICIHSRRTFYVFRNTSKIYIYYISELSQVHCHVQMKNKPKRNSKEGGKTNSYLVISIPEKQSLHEIQNSFHSQ